MESTAMLLKKGFLHGALEFMQDFFSIGGKIFDLFCVAIISALWKQLLAVS
jgi:hypothetical protein